MSTLNLKQYLAKIDILLEDNYYDEAIFHSRHILSLHPKNLATYRRLGRAEVGANRWEDANNTLRRILSFMPDDKIAHMGLSKVYQRAKKQDEALWHLERAYEQEPNNQAIIDELRELYQAYKNASNVRLQLTAGAVGRQYAKNQLYPQAIQVLKGALKQTPKRIDLRLMLARVYRESGDVVAAAETALDVLDALPDCLDANYIMTEVWLSEQRPSDAQRYLSAVEAIDPYLAIRLAQGHPAPDDLVEVPIADYKKTAQTLTDQKPDWLTEIDDGQNPLVELAEEDWANGEVDDPTLRLNTDQLLTTDFGDDDLSWLDDPTSPVSAEETHIPENTRKRTGLSGMLTKFDDNDIMQGDDPHSIPTEEISFDDLFNESADANDIPADDNDDVMAWLTDMPHETQSPTTPSAEKSVHTTDTDDPLGWLRESGIKLNTDTLSDEMITRTKAATQALDPDDPMSWLHAGGIELVDENPDELFTPYEKVDSTTLKSGDEDPMAWLRDSGVEIDEDMPRKTIIEDDDAHDDPMAWLSDSGIELLEEDEAPIPTPTAQSTPLWQEDNSLLDEMLSMEDLTGQPNMQVASLNTPSSGTDTDWQDTMLDDSSDDFPDWLSDSQPTGDDDDFSFDDPQDDDDTPDWLMDAKPTDANFDPDATNIGMLFGNDTDDDDSVTDTPDWLMDMKPTESSVAETDFDFLSDDIDAIAEESDTDFAFAELSSDDDDLADDDDTPDWLSGVTSSDTAEEADTDFAFAELASDHDDLADDDDTPDWLSGVTSSDTAEEADTDFAFAELSADDDALADDDDTPDWLTSMGDVEESAAEEADTDFAFAELSADDDALADDDDTPDWLTSMGDVEESATEEADTDFAFAELSADDDALADDDDTPDWLTNMKPAEAVTEESEEEFDFLADDLGDDDSLVTEDAPEWLMDARPEAETDRALDWLAEDESEEAVAEDTPSWLSALDDDAQEELTVEEEATWLSDESAVGEFDETVPVLAEIGALTLSGEAAELHTPAENAPDWLNALVPGLDIDYDADEDAQVEQHFLSDEAVVASSAKFAWLNTIVEAEVNQPPMTMPSAKTIVTAPIPTPRRNWSFSRPPAWLTPSQPTGIKPINRVQNPLPTSDSDFDEFDADDDDVPDWLLDDNDDEPDFLRDNF